MFNTLFFLPIASSRHANAPLAKARRAFLSHLASQGVARATLKLYAGQMLLVASVLKRRPGQIEDSEIDHWAQRLAKRPRQRGHVKNLKLSAYNVARVARAWCSFMGWLKKPKAKPFRIPLIMTCRRFT